MSKVMLHFMNVALLSLLLLAGPAAQAQGLNREQAVQALSATDSAARAEAASRLGEVGTMADAALLVRALRDPDEDVRDSAEQAMWRVWSRSGNAEVDALYATGVVQMSVGEVPQSIATFSRIIKLKPDFAEGWNKRATLYFLAGDLRKSLADCDEVVKRNPYHFGVLAGYAQIYARMEYYERALEYSRRALEINPNMTGVKRNIELLERLLEQRRRQTI
jgi:tetratricopeptide (TPR) repeat protein